MREDLELLVELQNIDKRLSSLEEFKGDLPDRIAGLEHRLEMAEDNLRAEEERLRELEKERRHFEREVDSANAELERYQRQLFEVKTNREYQALQSEIENQKSKIEEFESEVLLRMTSIDEIKEKVEEGSESLAELRGKMEAEIKRLKEELDSVEDEVLARLDERKRLVVKIDDRLVKTYERVRKSKKGLAIVGVVKEACGGCFHKIPPQRIQEIKSKEKLVSCENCGRILVWTTANWIKVEKGI